MHTSKASDVTKPSVGRKFRVAAILDDMRDIGRGDEADVLETLFADETMTSYRLANVITKMGYEITSWPVKTYRSRYYGVDR